MSEPWDQTAPAIAALPTSEEMLVRSAARVAFHYAEEYVQKARITTDQKRLREFEDKLLCNLLELFRNLHTGHIQHIRALELQIRNLIEVLPSGTQIIQRISPETESPIIGHRKEKENG